MVGRCIYKGEALWLSICLAKLQREEELEEEYVWTLLAIVENVSKWYKIGYKMTKYLL